MILKTSDKEAIRPFLKEFYVPPQNSHKGQNGKILIIGGSSLFHAASLWAAQVASHFADMVHYASTKENEQIFILLKTKFTNGIVIPSDHIPIYVKEDDAVLIGPGMVRGDAKQFEIQNLKFENILTLKEEAAFTKALLYYLIHVFPKKRFVFDAGALQMMRPEWLLDLKTQPILTPHQKEFQSVFGIDVIEKDTEEKTQIVSDAAKRYHAIILLKAVDDIVSDGIKTYVIKGGNPGLTKGGSGDVLAGLTCTFYAKNDPLTAAVIASFVLKRAADSLSNKQGYWYNIDDLIDAIPPVVKELVFNL